MTPIDTCNLFSQGPPGPPGRLVGVELGRVPCPLPAPADSRSLSPHPLPSQSLTPLLISMAPRGPHFPPPASDLLLRCSNRPFPYRWMQELDPETRYWSLWVK